MREGISLVANSVLRADASVGKGGGEKGIEERSGKSAGKDGLPRSGIAFGIVCEIFWGQEDFAMVLLFFCRSEPLPFLRFHAAGIFYKAGRCGVRNPVKMQRYVENKRCVVCSRVTVCPLARGNFRRGGLCFAGGRERGQGRRGEGH
ncbi:MAG: hypothetical protein DBX55_02080 [Verrucomicrobia bacterium]|nr:MAG: hypothetical protein DBX55_02080 [Verrucomicrobiota bacterium]